MADPLRFHPNTPEAPEWAPERQCTVMGSCATSPVISRSCVHDYDDDEDQAHGDAGEKPPHGYAHENAVSLQIVRYEDAHDAHHRGGEHVHES